MPKKQYKLSEADKKLYEEFHEHVYPVRGIPNSKDFTYWFIVSYLDRYLSPGMKVLDIGCGNGILSFYCAKKQADVLGVDISDKAIVACKKAAKSFNLQKFAKFKSANFMKENLKDKFDLVIMSEIIEHIEEDQKAISTVSSLLKPGGVLILSTPSEKAPVHLIKMKFLGHDPFDIEVGHVRRYSVSKLVRMIKLAKLEVLETRKTEGIVRNFLFATKIGGKLLRYVRWYGKNIVMFIDNLSVPIIGESQIFVISRKPKPKSRTSGIRRKASSRA